MRKLAKKTLAMIAYMKKNPHVPASHVADKYGVSTPRVYALKRRIKEEQDEPLRLEHVALPLSGSDLAAPPQTTSVDAVLDSRAQDYGKFIEGAEIMQMVKRMVHGYIEQRGTQLAFDQREALDMIVHKMGRIINGNPDKADSWRDIAGYATLVADRLEGNAR